MKNTQSLAVRFGSKRHVVAVGSIREASQAWERLRDERDFTGPNSPRVTVVDVNTGKTVAYITYNGRAWSTDPRKCRTVAEMKEIEL